MERALSLVHVAPKTTIDRFAARTVFSALTNFRQGCLQIALPDGSLLRFGLPHHPLCARVSVHDWRLFRRLLWEQDIGAGETYAEGWWDTDNLPALCRMFVRFHNLWNSHSWFRPFMRARNFVAWKLQRNTRSRARKNISYHYDLSNELYATFLDDTLTYSCGVFPSPQSTLAEAQRAKLDFVCQQLELQPGQRVLEIGCGWGSFAIHAARHYGVSVHGITLSRQQLELARDRVAAAGLGNAIALELRDYRDLTGTYDHIVSIEMFEAVGHEYYRQYFRTVDHCLRRGGRFFLQTITIPDQRYDRYRREFDFIKKHVFPGGVLASLERILRTTKHCTHLRLLAMRDIGPHYATTLRHWRTRFLHQLDRLQELGFDRRFCRLWEFYLASCEAAFTERHIGDAQLLFVRDAV